MSAVAVVAIIVCVILSAIVYRQRVNGLVLISRGHHHISNANEWREKYFGIEVENEKIVEAYDNLGKRYAFLQKEYDELRKRHDDLGNKFDTEIKEFQTEHDAKYIYLEAHHEQALEEIKKQMEKYADLQGRYDAVCDERDNLGGELRIKYESKIISLENAVREITFKSEGTQVAYDAILDANRQLQDQLNKLHFAATSVQQQLDMAVKERDALNERLATIRDRRNEESTISYIAFDILTMLGEALRDGKVKYEFLDKIRSETNAELQS